MLLLHDLACSYDPCMLLIDDEHYFVACFLKCLEMNLCVQC